MHADALMSTPPAIEDAEALHDIKTLILAEAGQLATPAHTGKSLLQLAFACERGVRSAYAWDPYPSSPYSPREYVRSLVHRWTAKGEGHERIPPLTGDEDWRAVVRGMEWPVVANMTCASILYAQAARLGNADAQYTHALMLMYGLYGQPLSVPRALVNMHFAAAGGHVPAASALGDRYLHGLDVPHDCALAFDYLQRGAALAARFAIDAHGAADVQRSLKGHLRLTFGNLEAMWHDRVIREFQEGAANKKYYLELAERGDAEALRALALVHLLGIRQEHADIKSAFEFFHAAAKQGGAVSTANVGLMYLHGLAQESDAKVAAAFLTDSMKKGDAGAANTLAYMHLHGIGVERDDAAAFALLTKAANKQQPITAAHYNLALMHLQG
ncbi:sel1 repeat family protein, partial [archaeon]